MKTKFYIITLLVMYTFSLHAQIGYQVSLLSSATGEPRANEKVEVTIELTNSEGTVICTETKSETTNEFGILSLQVGSDKTFENMDWSKLPLYVSATVDGIMVGKSQILNVPVAEAAKTLVNVDLDLICKTWTGLQQSVLGPKYVIILNENMTYTYQCWIRNDADNSWILGYNGNSTYDVVGNTIYLLGGGKEFLYSPASLYYHNGHLYGCAYYGPVKFD